MIVVEPISPVGGALWVIVMVPKALPVAVGLNLIASIQFSETATVAPQAGTLSGLMLAGGLTSVNKLLEERTEPRFKVAVPVLEMMSARAGEMEPAA